MYHLKFMGLSKIVKYSSIRGLLPQQSDLILASRAQFLLGRNFSSN